MTEIVLAAVDRRAASTRGRTSGHPQTFYPVSALERYQDCPFRFFAADVLRLELAPAGKVSRSGVLWFCVDHANYAGEVPGIRIGRGIVAGLPDLFVLHAGRAYLIELKAADGQLSEPQKAFIAAGLCSAVHVGVACSVDDVLRLLDAWDIPRNKRVRMAA